VKSLPVLVDLLVSVELVATLFAENKPRRCPAGTVARHTWMGANEHGCRAESFWRKRNECNGASAATPSGVDGTCSARDTRKDS
jgi:hypothetical protein